MINLDLNNYGVQELDAVEMKETDGGSPTLVILGFALASFILVIVVPMIVEALEKE